MMRLPKTAFARHEVSNTEKRVHDALAKGEHQFDFEEVDEVNSATVALLVSLRRHGEHVEVFHLKDQVKVMAQLYGVYAWLTPMIREL